MAVTPYTSAATTYSGHADTATLVSITGVNGETGATVGTVDLSNTTHTNAGTYASDYWTFAGASNYNDISAKRSPTASPRPTPRWRSRRTPGHDASSGHADTATLVSITGVNGETGATVGTVDLSNTTHTNAGTYASDYWTFAGASNYNDISAPDDHRQHRQGRRQGGGHAVHQRRDDLQRPCRHGDAGSITGVNGETGATVGTVDLSNTTHTNAGTYASD